MATATGVRDQLNVCQLCGSLENLSLCGGCRGTWYCSKDHQRQDWKAHKRACKQTKMCGSDNTSSRVDNVNVDGHVGRNSILKQTTDKGSKGTIVSVNSNGSPSNEVNKSISSYDDETEANIAKLNRIRLNDSNSRSSQNQEHIEPSKHEEEKNQEDQNVFDIDHQGGRGDNQSKLNKSKNKSSQIKKKQKFDEQQLGNLPSSEECVPSQRYYLNKSTHRINLPSSTRAAAIQKAQNSEMGKGDNSISPSQSREQYLTVLRSRFSVLARYVVECLTKYGMCVIDKFLGEVTGSEILKEVRQLQSDGIMKQGQLVHGPSPSSNRYIRGDMITWVDGNEPRCENIHFLVSCMDAVMLQSATELEPYSINERTKAMVACYPGNSTRYVRHVDNPNGDGRCVTAIYYLNDNWDVRHDGGLLRIYPEGEDRVANIEPKLDRLLFFWSDRRNPHEVEQAFKERYAITVWYYDAEERAEALKRYKGSSESGSEKRQSVPLIKNNPELT